MIKQEFQTVTTITADDGKYLILKNTENSEELIGKPVRIILNNSEFIPEFEEREVL